MKKEAWGGRGVKRANEVRGKHTNEFLMNVAK
jgi:hypothetical protein